MSAHPRVLLTTVSGMWPTGSQIPARWIGGELIDVVPGSPLEAGIGAGNLRNATLADYLGHGTLQN